MTLSLQKQYRLKHNRLSAERSAYTVHNWMLLYGVKTDSLPSEQEISEWTSDERGDAEYYLRYSHYKASDNIVRVPEMPERLRKIYRD